MENGTLHDLLGSDQGSSTLSPVTVSWKMRMDVLLGVSRAIEHLHYHAHPPIIHRDIKSANILFDESWVPRVADFGLPVSWDVTKEKEGMEFVAAGTLGYLDPEYYAIFLLKPASDVYNLGVMMLEVLTGKEAVFYGEKGTTHLPYFAVPLIEAGNLGELLDGQPSPEPTPCELQASF
ncbi:putative serine/threonine-protein kinase-like protein CCR3 [Triticum dicoccoides]|uniref:putative serine/threonine-protein kinase-like protein CCR3 n=1 Tax=Triticum dicoccoides TaxID=85692 RepID=UPI00188E4AB5|nr:putative serine/threonine-protein kinase-like protein CCR3 [Triticum dicoccoides]